MWRGSRIADIGCDVFTVASGFRVCPEILHLVPDWGERTGGVSRGIVHDKIRWLVL